MKKKAEGLYFIDTVFCGEKTPEMVEFLKARVDVALGMIRNERAGVNYSLIDRRNPA